MVLGQLHVQARGRLGLEEGRREGKGERLAYNIDVDSFDLHNQFAAYKQIVCLTVICACNFGSDR